MQTAKKLVALALVATSVVFVAPSASAATATELQAQIQALLQQINQLQAQLSTQTGGTTPTSACFTKTLKLGMKDAEVTTLQGALKSDSSIYPEGLVTGYFGALTEKAVKKFQAKYGIEQVGLVGPATRAKLNSLYCTTPTPTTSGTATPVPTPVTGGVSVTLAGNTTAAGSVICHTTSTSGAQALAPFTSFVFTTGANAAKVTGLKINRSGVSTNSDVSNVYLYEGNTKLAEMVSITSDNVVTFSNSSGLFTIPANSSKTITVRADLANGGSSGKTMRFGIDSAANITLEGGAAATGVFPVNGNYMTWATVNDLGTFTIADTETHASAVDPSATAERELWRISSNAQNQKVELRFLKFTMIGTAAYSDFKDLKLTIGANVYGPKDLESDKTVTFDLSANPYIYDAGQTKNVILSGKVIGGASRNFYFALQNMSDIVAYDRNYNVYLKPNQNDTFGIKKASAATIINGGSLTITRASDSPTGNIAVGATNVDIAKFAFTAAGENMKVMSLAAHLNCSVSTTTIKNVKLYVDGSQVGSTDSTVTCDGAEDIGWGTFGNSFIVNAGQTRTITIKADMTQTSARPAAGDTVSATLEANTSNVQRMTTGDYTDTALTNGNSLTVKSGNIIVAKNVSMSSGTSSNPTAVAGETDVKIGSFTVTGGLGEAVDVTQFVIKDVVGDFPTYFSNLKLKDSANNQIGSTYGTLTASAATTYSFVPTTSIRINAGQQAVFNIFADIKNTVSAGAMATTTVDAVYATGVDTSTTADDTTSDPTLQSTYATTRGTLTITLDPNTPITQQIVSGKSYEFARYKLASNASEDVKVTEFIVNDFASAAGDIADLTAFNLYDVTSGTKTLVAGPVYSIVPTNATGSGYVTFTGFNLVVPKSSNKVLAVEAQITPWYSGQAANTHAIKVAADYLTTSGTSSPATVYGVKSNTQLTDGAGLVIGAGAGLPLSGNTMTVYRSRISVAVASDSPSGATVPSATHQIFKFVVSNENNEGAYTATVKDVAITLNATNLTEGTSHAILTRTFTLYKDSVTDANIVGKMVLSCASSTSCSYGGTLDFASSTASTGIAEGWTSYSVSTASGTAFSTSGVEISAGSSKTFILVADTTTPKTTSTATSYINPTLKASLSSAGGSTYGITWTDGDASTITTVDTLPLDSTSKTLSW